jgi:type II secretory pathway pseudopilin PulG
MKRRGISLLEVMFAVGLLGMSALFLMGLSMSGLRLSGHNREATVAAKLGQQLFETVRHRSTVWPAGTQTWRGKNNDPQVQGFPPNPYPAATIDQQTYYLTVHTEPVVGETGLMNMQVTLTWGNGHQTTLQSYFRVD